MKWIAISGSGRGLTPEIEQAVRASVREIIQRGDGIVTGGVLGVDYISTDEVLTLDPSAKQIKVCLPAPFETYLQHFKDRPDITSEEGHLLGNQLKRLQIVNPKAIMSIAKKEHTTGIDKTSYESRNDLVLQLASELLAFPINKSKGTQYTIDKARALGLPVDVREYTTTH